MFVEVPVIKFCQKIRGWFIDIVDVNYRLLVKATTTSIVVELPEMI